MDLKQSSIPIARPTLFGDELAALGVVLDSGWLSQGPTVERFERTIADWLGAPHAIATTSWTTAFHLLLLVYGIGPGDDVICPSYSFIATANVIAHAGATPRFADIDAATWNLDPQAVETLIQTAYQQDASGVWCHRKTGNRLRAIEIVHQIGLPADLDAFSVLCDRYGLLLLEDAACAIGSTYKGKPVGGCGHPAAFSFHPRKVLTTGEGGLLLLYDDALAEQARMLRTHGMSISDRVRHAAGSTVFESYPCVGYNYKMTDLQAALGCSQFGHLEAMLTRREVIRQQYDAAFSECPALEILRPPAFVTRWNVQSYPIMLNPDRLHSGVLDTRNTLMAALDADGISSRRGIPCAHAEPAYHTGQDLPESQATSDRTLFLPIFPEMTEADVARVIASVQRHTAPLTETKGTPIDAR